MDRTINLEIIIEGLPTQKTIEIEATEGSLIKDFLKVCDKHLEGRVVNWYVADQGNRRPLNWDKDKVTNDNKKVFGVVVAPYSYHNFLFPFLWNDDAKVASRNKFSKCLNPYWSVEQTSNYEKSQRSKEEKYKQYHYFNPAARNAIYSNGTGKDEVVWNYTYNVSETSDEWLESVKTSDNKAEYVINCDETEYILKVNGIRLKLFNTGIGIVIFELENYSYPEYKDVVKINDFGRQVYAPYIQNGTCSACPKEIVLRYGKDTDEDGRFIDHFVRYDNTRLSQPIQKLFTNRQYTITANANEANDRVFHIEPIVDNRMYVACYYLNEQLIKDMCAWKNGRYAYQEAITEMPLGSQGNPNRYNPASQLYELVYVDGNGLTCQSRNRLAQSLSDKYVYDRWIEYGTITGVTEYSFITITNSPADYLAETFLIEYVEIMVLALAQRASLLNFERMISNSTCSGKDICDIQRRYLRFQSQLLLKEVTPQQQGIELYRMMLNNMFVFDYATEIENQIDDLFTQNTAQSEAQENKILFILAALGVFEIIDIVGSWLALGYKQSLVRAVPGACVIFVLIIWIYLLRKKKRK